MSFIDFPDVPQVPGVPDLRRAAVGIAAVSGVLGKLAGLDHFGALDGALGPQWGIYDKQSRMVIVPDSVVALEYRGEQRISKYPVEAGSFSSYNKVAMPYDIRILMTCSGTMGSQLSDLTSRLQGNGAMTKEAFLAALEAMKASTDLYDLVTPDFTYQNVNLVRFDYRRQATNGATLLIVDAQFEEVRVTATSTYAATAQAFGAPEKSIGTVKAGEPTAQQSAAFGSSAIS